ncbi:MAG TPA: RiPP maturation radical SAM C-methyltransferase [Thermoguttaceae bacterium]|nr:RiPP maturation radical SAM C-methyltransferase [Thermoguttaceae bacterium]
MSRVLIVNMPFSNLRWPNIGPSLLKAALVRRGIGCDVAYLNFDFAERVGLDHYYWLADHFAFVLGGERLFAKHYFQGQLPDDDRYWRDVLLPTDAGLTPKDRCDFERTEEHVEPFLDHCVESIDWSPYAIVGFATSFQQTMPSMCLARRIRKLRPEAKSVFGGAACEAEMGIELLAQFPEIDYVFLGEADLTFPPVVEQIIEGKRPELPPGVVGRESLPIAPGEVATACRGPLAAPDPAGFMVRDMDALPHPDFDDYFRRLETSPLKVGIRPLLFFETSRGCWWGQKHHCKFCGLNGSTLAYRSKSPQRAVDELRRLVERYGVHQACSSDNILDYRYFDTFLPMLEEAEIGLAFVFEMKTNMTRRQVETLMDAGMGAAQLGIETFITSVLRLIGKGANAVQNLQTLKWFSEHDVEVKWNVLYGFPGEDPDDYAALADLIPSIVHLAPPLAVGRVRLDRFSPYFEAPEAHGMANPRPNEAFAYVYPFPDDVLRRMAYYYEYDYADGRNPLDYATPALEQIETWQSLNHTVTLRMWDRPDGVLILTDTRPCAVQFQRRLTGLDREIYLYCDTGRSLKRIFQFAAEHSDGEPVDESALKRTLDQWVDERIMARLDNRYLSLGLRAGSSDDGEGE